MTTEEAVTNLATDTPSCFLCSAPATTERKGVQLCAADACDSPESESGHHCSCCVACCYCGRTPNDPSDPCPFHGRDGHEECRR